MDIKAEITRVEAEIKQISQQIAILDQQISAFQSQRQALLNSGIKKSGELELLQRLDKENG